MSGIDQTTLEGALAGLVPPAVPADAIAGSVPPIPDAATEAAAVTLEGLRGIEFGNRMRRRWYLCRDANQRGEVPPPQGGTRTELYDPGCQECKGMGMVADRSRGVHVPYTFCTCGAAAKIRAEQRDAAKWSMLAALPHARFRLSEDRPEQRAAMDLATVFIEDVDAARGTWLTYLGDTVGGKTHLAACIGNALLDAGHVVLMHKVPALLDHFRAAFNPNVGGQFDALFEKVKNVEVLVLDDLGAENRTDWAADKLYQLLDERTVYRRPTVVTTNDLLDNLGRRILGRVALTPGRRVCLVPTGRGKPEKGYYMVQHQPWLCAECGCRPCWAECGAHRYPDTLGGVS